jgi:hypothetical protein
VGAVHRGTPRRGVGAQPSARAGAAIIAGLAEVEGFALPGGAALIARGDVQRQTHDLDFFGLSTNAVDRLVPAADRALREAGLIVRHVQENHGFARMIGESGDDRTELDLGADARLFPAEPGRPAPTLSGEELAVDKVLVVLGPAEARDFVDLAAIEGRYGLERLFGLAAEKDRGFTPEMFRRDGGPLLPTSTRRVRHRRRPVRGAGAPGG